MKIYTFVTKLYTKATWTRCLVFLMMWYVYIWWLWYIYAAQDQAYPVPSNNQFITNSCLWYDSLSEDTLVDLLVRANPKEFSVNGFIEHYCEIVLWKSDPARQCTEWFQMENMRFDARQSWFVQWLCQTYDVRRQEYEPAEYEPKDYKAVFDDASYSLMIDGKKDQTVKPELNSFYEEDVWETDNIQTILSYRWWLEQEDDSWYDVCDPARSNMNSCELWYIYHNILKSILWRYVDMRKAALVGLDLDESEEIILKNIINYYADSEFCQDDNIDFIQETDVKAGDNWYCGNPETFAFMLAQAQQSLSSIDRRDRYEIWKPRTLFQAECVSNQESMLVCSMQKQWRNIYSSDTSTWLNLLENEKFWSNMWLEYMIRAIDAYPNIQWDLQSWSLTDVQKNMSDMNTTWLLYMSSVIRDAVDETNIYLEDFALAYAQYIPIKALSENIHSFNEVYSGPSYTAFDQTMNLFLNNQDEKPRWS